MSTLGLYIHVPFCAKKCAYCAFYSGAYSARNAAGYVDAVKRNLRYYSDKSRITDTIYFGGGTPSLLSAVQLGDILSCAAENFCIAPDTEITLEANPSTLSPKRLAEFRGIGINRLSIGVQTMNDEELKFLGRAHTAERAKKAVLNAYDTGFENISCDLMAAIPNQTLGSLKRSIEELSALPIQHVSAYLLKTEAGTPFDCDEIKRQLPTDDEAAELYETMVKELESHGFEQYEVSNFAKKGFESRHNCRYWKCSDYIGIGPSAHSCNNGRRFAAECTTDEFIASDIQPTVITDESPCGFEEFSMLRLRLKEGLALSEVPEHRADIEKKLPPLINAGYVTFDSERVALTSSGFLMSNSVISYIIF